MKETGLIFNGDMVRATLDGRKTQTRRIIKPQREGLNWSVKPAQSPMTKVHTHDWWLPNGTLPYSALPRCPYGVIGDRIWVRETWGVVSHAFDDDCMMTKWIPDRPATAINEMPFGNGYYSGHVIYAADGSFTWGDDDGHEDGRSCWKPSIFMPRAASRITLEITGVRVERLNDISPEDAESEGLERTNFTGFGDEPGMPCFPEPDVYRGTKEHGWTECPSEAFQHLWQSLYGEESWQKNPWCWVIEFQRVNAD